MEILSLPHDCYTPNVPQVDGNKAALITRILDKEKDSEGGVSGSGSKLQGVSMPDRGTFPTGMAAQLGTELYEELRAALEDKGFLEGGGLVGVPCMHLYEQVQQTAVVRLCIFCCSII